MILAKLTKLKFPINPVKRIPSSQGFTLLELMAVLAILGIVAAVSAPTGIGVAQRAQLNRAAAGAQGFVRETHRHALTSGTTCRVMVDPTQLRSECNGIPHRVEPMPSQITLGSDVGDLVFTFRGLVVNACPSPTNCGTITVQSTVGSRESRCVRVESLMGSIPPELICGGVS